MQSQMTSHCQS